MSALTSSSCINWNAMPIWCNFTLEVRRVSRWTGPSFVRTMAQYTRWFAGSGSRDVAQRGLRSQAMYVMRFVRFSCCQRTFSGGQQGRFVFFPYRSLVLPFLDSVAAKDYRGGWNRLGCLPSWRFPLFAVYPRLPPPLSFVQIPITMCTLCYTECKFIVRWFNKAPFSQWRKTVRKLLQKFNLDFRLSNRRAFSHCVS